MVQETAKKQTESVMSKVMTDINGTLRMISELLETVNMAIEAVGENNTKVTEISRDVQARLAEALNKMATCNITQKAPQVNVTVDTEAMARSQNESHNILRQLISQNQSIVEAIQKFQPTDNGPFAASIRSLVEKSTTLTVEGLKIIDYTKDVSRMAAALEKRPTSIEFERDMGNRIIKAKLIY